MIPRSLLFHCISLPVCEVKRLSQALCWPRGLIGCSHSCFQDLQALGTCCPRSCIFYKLGQDSHTMCTLSSYRIHTAAILAVLCIQVCTSELSDLCGLLTALSLNILIARSLLVLLGRGYLISILDCWQPGSPPGLMPQFQLLLEELFTHTKGYRSDASSLTGIPSCPSIHTKVTYFSEIFDAEYNNATF
jgi:hypothetical protein